LVGVIKENGGDIQLNTSVSRIVVDNQRVTGVQLSNGQILASETVISNADVRRTFMELVGRDHLPSYLSNRIEMLQPSNSAFMVSLGVDFVPDIKPATFVTVGNKKLVIMVPSKVDPSLAPQGHSCITLLTLLSHEQSSLWKRNEPEYVERKRQFGEELIAVAENIIPGLREHILFRQDASPATFTRYVQTIDGAVYGLSIDEWRPSAKSPIEGLYLAGAGIAARPGVESAVYSGIMAADLIMKKEGRNLGKSPKGVLDNALC
jgi:phytoene dehydrogenase-like protein